MNTARIVVLTIAVGAGGIAAYPASGSDSKPPPAKPVAQLRIWPASTASNSIADLNAGDSRDDGALKRSDSVNVVGFAVSTPTTTQK